MSEINYSGYRFNLYFKERHPPLWLSLWTNKYFLRAYRQLTTTDVGFLYFIEGNEFTGYMQSDGPDIIFRRLRRIMTPAWMQRQRSLFDRRRQRIDRLLSQSQRRELQDKERKAVLLSVYRTASSLYPFSNAFYLLSQKLEWSIQQRLMAKHPRQRVNQILARASTPIHPTTLQRYHRDLEALAQRLKRDRLTSLPKLRQSLVARPSIKQRLDALHRRYKFLTSIGAGERTETTLLREIIEAQRSSPRPHTDVIVPNDVRSDVILLRNMAYFKDEVSSAIIPLIKFGFLNLWKQTARQLGLSLHELEQLPGDVLFRQRLSAATARARVIRLRRGIMFLHTPGRTVTTTTGRRATGLYRRLVAKSKRPATPVTSLRGQVGSSGKVRGIVQVITSSSNINTFKKGRVLVTVYTAPEFVPAMKLAAAVITDVGGTTSHAAIVSRELGKPCIVNTNVATRSLANGDKVEVDAYRGIVTILKKVWIERRSR